MIEALLDHLNNYIKVSDDTKARISQSFRTHILPKKKIILKEGEPCAQMYFVAKGCLRMYYFDEKGTEHTIQFALENWWMTDLDAFHKKGSASVNIQSVENTTLLGITKHDFDSLLEKHPELEKYFRHIYERAYAASLTRMKYFRLPKEESYELFASAYPAFVQRVPQKLLASFLGFTPEYLSELRKKSVLKPV
jgi:CRP-like cAMP-binding protein